MSHERWFEELSSALLEDGSAELVVAADHSGQLADALLRIAVEPIDSEAVLVHARLTAIQRDANQIKAEIELPEALQ
jgi:hypothetical protein